MGIFSCSIAVKAPRPDKSVVFVYRYKTKYKNVQCDDFKTKDSFFTVIEREVENPPVQEAESCKC